MNISDFRLAIADLKQAFQRQIGNWQSKIGNVLAGLTRFELAISASTVQRFGSN
jgi:hypothetical protein